MRVNALCFVMLMVIRTPFRLEVEDIEVEVLVLRQQMVDQTHFDILNRVREGTIVSVLALLNFVREAMTEFGLILVLMV